MTGRMPAEGVNQADFPHMLAYLWAWFLDLHVARGGGMGPAAISFSELRAYFDLQGIRPQPWEVNALRMLDNVALESFQSQNAT